MAPQRTRTVAEDAAQVENSAPADGASEARKTPECRPCAVQRAALEWPVLADRRRRRVLRRGGKDESKVTSVDASLEKEGRARLFFNEYPNAIGWE